MANGFMQRFKGKIKAAQLWLPASGLYIDGVAVTVSAADLNDISGDSPFVTTIAGAGTNQATATAITRDKVSVTGADGTVGVVLGTPTDGRPVFVTNTNASNVLKVYPAVGGTINALSANAAFALGPGRTVMFVAATATQWYAATYATATPTVAETNALTGVTLGTGLASKVMSLDASGHYTPPSGSNFRRSYATPAGAGTNQATATAMTADLNMVTGADGTVGVALPVAVAGDEIVVVNTVANQILKVYPVNGGAAAINAASVNASFALAPGAEAVFKAESATQWRVAVRASQLFVQGIGDGYKLARGQSAVTGTLTVITGLATVVSVVASADSDIDGAALANVSATIGDQSGAPAAGSVILKCWKVTTGGAAGNPTEIAAGTAKNVNWIAIGT